MYAIIRHNSYDPNTAAQAEKAQAELHALHTGQAGYAGSLVVDIGSGERVAVNLWESEGDARTGMAALGAEAMRLVKPVSTAPSRLLGAGEVVATDLSDLTDSSTANKD